MTIWPMVLPIIVFALGGLLAVRISGKRLDRRWGPPGDG